MRQILVAGRQVAIVDGCKALMVFDGFSASRPQIPIGTLVIVSFRGRERRALKGWVAWSSGDHCGCIGQAGSTLHPRIRMTSGQALPTCRRDALARTRVPPPDP
jgi:hypothetical protein